MNDREMVPEFLGSLIQLPPDTPQEVVDHYNQGFTKAFREFLAKCRAEFPMIDATMNGTPHVYIAFMALALNEVDSKSSERGGVVANATNAYIDAVKATIKLAFMQGVTPEIQPDGALVFPSPHRPEDEASAMMTTLAEQLLERITKSSGEMISAQEVLDTEKLT